MRRRSARVISTSCLAPWLTPSIADELRLRFPSLVNGTVTEDK